MKPVVIITGPTAVGKTKLSIELAKYFNGEVINADASQMHRYLNIGTAKITKEEMKDVKHHLIDFLNPNEQYSIKDFQTDGRELISKIDYPFIVGGSGLYIQALITNYNLDTSSRDETIYEPYSNEELYNKLINLDREAASKLHPNNRRRVIRYLEIASERGIVKTVNADPIYNNLIICLNRDRKDLYNNINQRVDIMFNNGWIFEVKSLIDQGVDVSQIKEIGYKEIYKYLNNELTYEGLLNTIKQKTRNYAKRQITWFKNKMNCIFVNLENDNLSNIYKLIEQHFKSE